MDVRDLEIMLASLFDPEITFHDKVSLLRREGGGVRYSWCLSDDDGVVPISGVEVVFKDDTAYRLVIISAHGN